MKAGEGIYVATAFIVESVVFVVKVGIAVWILHLVGCST